MKLQRAYWLLLICLLSPAALADDWLLLEFIRNQPPCQNAEPGDRCWATLSDSASFEVRSGETLSLPRSGLPPPAWVQLRKLWVYAEDAVQTQPHFLITVDRTPGGARLQMSDGTDSYLQSLALNEWTQLIETTPAGTSVSRQIWARVSAD